ncbi:MAG: DUF4430 domain-containing protein [Candidatus Bathyarchaeota archaeon]|jgi:hypothetical protein|nr:DUF4430 domain-containing protein [Candidatus Bathyarchaeota archaeon A05DMB-3]MDH7607232.1 DUF4430 domain-containing protein [Candidatus Bathyarchaeota archaeon]
MELSKRSLTIFGLGWLTSLILVGYVAGYYYMECQNLVAKLREYEGCVMHVNICLNYGSGTVKWHNNTVVLAGCDLLSATKRVATVNYTYWPSQKASFVDAINNVWNNGTYYWMWYHWTNDSWEYGHVGADTYILSPNETVMWRYEKPHYP